MRSSTKVGDGIPFIVWALMWLLGGVVALVLLGYDILLPHIDRMVGRDFTNLWVAGKLVWAGDAGCIFDVNCFRIAEYDRLHLLALQNYSYPPPALFIAAPFALMPYYLALAVWTIAGMAFFTWCARAHLPNGFPPHLAALTSAATINIWNGHYGFLLGGLWLLCFQNVDKRPTRSGIFAGLLTFKPHLGLMIAATIVRNWRAVAAAVLTTIALIVISAMLFGAGPWNGFLIGTTTEQQQILTRASPDFYFRMMPSAYVAFGRGNAGLLAQAITALATIAMLIKYRRWDAFSAATATFLLIPYVFNYDMTVACLGFAIAVYVRWNSMHWLERLAFLLAFVSPELTYFVPYAVPPVLLAALYFQLREASAHATEGRETPGKQGTCLEAPNGSVAA